MHLFGLKRFAEVGGSVVGGKEKGGKLHKNGEKSLKNATLSA